MVGVPDHADHASVVPDGGHRPTLACAKLTKLMGGRLLHFCSSSCPNAIGSPGGPYVRRYPTGTLQPFFPFPGGGYAAAGGTEKVFSADFRRGETD